MAELETKVGLEGTFRLQGFHKGTLIYEGVSPNSITSSGASQARKGIVAQQPGTGNNYIGAASIYWEQYAMSASGVGVTARFYKANGQARAGFSQNGAPFIEAKNSSGTTISSPFTGYSYSVLNCAFKWDGNAGHLPTAASTYVGNWSGWPEVGSFSYGGYWWPPNSVHSGHSTGHASNCYQPRIWPSSLGTSSALLFNGAKASVVDFTNARPTVGTALNAVAAIDEVDLYYTIKCTGLTKVGNELLLHSLMSPPSNATTGAKVHVYVPGEAVATTPIVQWDTTDGYKTVKIVATTPAIATSYPATDVPTFQLIAETAGGNGPHIIAEHSFGTMAQFNGQRLKFTWNLNLPKE